MPFKTVLAIAAIPFCLCLLASSGISSGPTPQPGRVSGLKAITMEKRLYRDIKNAQDSGRDTSTAEKLKVRGDAELKEGRLQAAIKHYEDAENALGAAK